MKFFEAKARKRRLALAKRVRNHIPRVPDEVIEYIVVAECRKAGVEREPGESTTNLLARTKGFSREAIPAMIAGILEKGDPPSDFGLTEQESVFLSLEGLRRLSLHDDRADECQDKQREQEAEHAAGSVA